MILFAKPLKVIHLLPSLDCLKTANPAINITRRGCWLGKDGLSSKAARMKQDN